MPLYRYLYVHVPFCDGICHYCHFYKEPARGADQQGFFTALLKDIATQQNLLASELDAVYLGGGTPSASSPELIASFLASLGPRLTSRTEVTIEANPSKASRYAASRWREAGINRVSIGVQSLDDRLLKKLGRQHSAAEARKALDGVRAEIGNVSCDLIYAVPGQPEGLPARDALELVERGANHLSAYHLTLEKEHFLFASLPPDDFAWKQIHRVAEALIACGLRHYEVASFTRPGFESRNNQNYWSGGPYLALGPSAHGFDGKRERWSNVSDWRDYVKRAGSGESTRAWTENLTDEQRRIEVIFTSLRTDQGLDLVAFRDDFGLDLASQKSALFERWEKEGLGHLAQGKFVLTFRGRMLIDEIARALI